MIFRTLSRTEHILIRSEEKPKQLRNENYLLCMSERTLFHVNIACVYELTSNNKQKKAHL